MTRSVFTERYARLRAALVAARRERDLTQKQVAAKLRRPQSFVSKYEQGERRLDVIEFLDVTYALNVHPCTVLEQIRRR